MNGKRGGGGRSGHYGACGEEVERGRGLKFTIYFTYEAYKTVHMTYNNAMTYKVQKIENEEFRNTIWFGSARRWRVPTARKKKSHWGLPITWLFGLQL